MTGHIVSRLSEFVRKTPIWFGLFPEVDDPESWMGRFALALSRLGRLWTPRSSTSRESPNSLGLDTSTGRSGCA